MPTLERAIEIAARAHAGQLDKAGQPYILHPLRVMLALKGGEERIAAAGRAARNPIARGVELADVADNRDLDRIAKPTAKDVARLEEYQQVRALLLAHEA